MGKGEQFGLLALRLGLAGSGIPLAEGWDAWQGPGFGQPLRHCHSSELCCSTSSLGEVLESSGCQPLLGWE